jgi:hypothetical protein
MPTTTRERGGASSQPQQIERLPAREVALNVGQGVGIVAVGDKRHLRADELSRRFDDIEGELVNLDRGDPGVQRLLDTHRDLVRLVVAIEAGHHRHTGPLRPSEQGGERVTCGLARNIPERHIDCGQCIEIGAGAAERGQAKPGLHVQALSLLHRFAEEERRDGVADRGDQAPLHGRPKAQALAISDQPGPGRHPAEDQMQRVGRRAGGASRSVEGKPQGDRVYAIDDHGISVNAGSLAK